MVAGYSAWCTSTVITLLISSTFSNIFVISTDSSGFCDWFIENLDEFENKPIVFTKPIPEWIHGILIRNGGGRHEFGRRKNTHVFDSYAKLHSFKFHGNGTASFSAKFIQSEYYNQSNAANTIVPYMQMDLVDPPFSDVEIIEAFLHNMDNTNVNVYRIYNHAKKSYEYMTTTDIWKVYQIDENLSTITPIVPKADVSKLLYVSAALSSAHPIKEYGKENYFTFLTSISKMPFLKSKMTLYRMNTVAERKRVVSWEIEDNRYIHSFSVTKNYVVIVAPPIIVNTYKLITMGYVFGALEWKDEAPTYIYLIDLRTLKVRTLKHDSFYFFHHINAYEENEEIMVDLCTFDNATTIKMYEFAILNKPELRNSMQFKHDVKRLVIHPETYSVKIRGFKSTKIPYSTSFDFPVINENFRHLKYCYVYGIASKIDNINLDRFAIVKKDMCDPSGDKSWAFKNHYPSEATFIPTPGSTREDDGILISHVFDGILKKTKLIFLNATTMDTISESTLPSHIPMAFHGRFFPDY